MSDVNRRQFLKGLIGRLAQATGVVVIASASAATARTEEDQTEKGDAAASDVQERADRLVANATSSAVDAEEAEAALEFLNGAFRNTPLGAFRNTPLTGFRNTPLGAFRNTPVSGFRNTPLGSFGNGGWPNGILGGFQNGGWPNGGWGNWW